MDSEEEPEGDKDSRSQSQDESPEQKIPPQKKTRTVLNVSTTPSLATPTKSVKFQEILNEIESPVVAPERPIFSRLTNAVRSQLKRITEKTLNIRRSKSNKDGSFKEDNRSRRFSTKFETLLRSVRGSIGSSELIREIRAKEQEYVHQVDELFTMGKVNTLTEDHPYIALRKRIEAMTRTGKQEYKIQYEPLLNKPKFADTRIPIYSTDYENERRKQARRRQFMFGLGAQDRFDPERLDAYLYDPTVKPDKMHWSSKQESNVAFLALIFSVSNLFRFPHACYVNGGIIFFLVYCFLIVTLIRPLIFFEMLIGQFSWKGEWGFGRLHRYARGFPHALTFVNLTFVTLNNAILGYAGLYAIGALYAGPGLCHPEWFHTNGCIPYDEVENSKSKLIAKRIWIEKNFREDGSGFQNATLFLSTELFFRFYVLNWKGKISRDFYHWKFVLAFLVVMFVVIPASLHTQLVSTISRMWIYFAGILPILLSVVLFHQYAFRDGYYTPKYFSVPNWGRLGTLKLWRDAFEMAFTTVGVGYGVLIRVASKNDFRFNRINQTSWIISILVMVFSLLCSMVVYTELAILGFIAEAKEFTHIFAEGFGVSFVCLSGALLKFLPTWAFTICFAAMNIFNIWAQIVTTHMSTQYISDVIPVAKKSVSLTIGLVVTILIQIILISIYAAHAEYATTDSFDLYGGSAAACTILLAEIGIAFVLWGFREFMADIGIMLDRQPSFTYQIQMKYFIPPALFVALFMITLSWLHTPPTLDNRRNASLQTYYFAIFLNSMPIVIMGAFALIVFRQRNKVAPVLEETTFIEKKHGLQLYWKTKSRWMGRRGAVATAKQTNLISKSGASLLTNYAMKMDIHKAREVYYVHTDLKKSLRTLLAKTKSKAQWRDFINKMIVKNKFKTLSQLTRHIMRRKETKRIWMEVTFLKNLIHKCSVCDLATSSVKHLNGVTHDNQESILLDHLFKNTDIESSDESSYSLYTTNSNEEGTQEVLSDLSRATSSSGDSRVVFRKILGKLSRSPAEIKLDLVVRIKKALGLVCEKEIAELRKLRSRRFYDETNATWWGMINPPPEEKFITIKVIKRGEAEFVILNIRIIILRCSDHFVLRRLPVPAPVVVHTTNEELESFPGIDTSHKIYSLVIQNLKSTLWKADLSQLGPENRTPLLENLDLDIYRFIDPVRSCVVILERDQEVHRLKNKWRWLKQPTRRKHRLEEIPIIYNRPFEIEEVTISSLTKRQMEIERIDKLLTEPPDIIYHPPNKDSTSNESISPPTSRFSSSSSNEDNHQYKLVQETAIPKGFHHGQYAQLVNETVLKENRKALRKTLGGYKSNTSQDSVSSLTVKHLTNQDWKINRMAEDQAVVVLHKNPGGLRDVTSVKFLNPMLDVIANKEVENDISTPAVHSMLDNLASVRTVWSEAEQRLKVKTKTDKSSYSISTTVSSSKSLKDFSNLKNNYEEFAYYTDRRTLIIEPKDPNRVIVMASSEDSIASSRRPSKNATRTTLARATAKTVLQIKENV